MSGISWLKNIMSGPATMLKPMNFIMSRMMSDLVISSVESRLRRNIASCLQNIMSGNHNIMSGAAIYYEWSVCENMPKNMDTVSCGFFFYYEWPAF